VTPGQYRFLADAVLFAHVLIVLFVVLGLLATWIGAVRNWAFVRDPWFRGTHLLAIVIIVLQAWGGALCPLTVWEHTLRTAAGEAGYDMGFIAHWTRELLFYEAPPWLFAVAYTVFAVLVAFAWWRCPPRSIGRSSNLESQP
jgi:hypothetical protein